MSIRPLSAIQVIRHQIPAHAGTPNTSIQAHPVLIYKGAFDVDSSSSTTTATTSSSSTSSTVGTYASAMEAHLRAVGAVEPQWRYTMYATSHFHSTTHEVLCVAAGRARLLLGGDGNAHAVRADVRRGDALLLPAGVGHRLLEDVAGGGFLMVGAYPPGRRWDMCYGGGGSADREEERRVRETIAALPWFDKDPLYGDGGPAVSDA